MKIIYIARKFVYTEGGARHIYEECIFDTFELAFKFIKYISNEYDDYFLSEIVSYDINNTNIDQVSNIHIYDKNATLVFSTNNSSKYDIKNEFEGKFSVGDIVVLQPFPWNASSPTVVETIGVVSMVPVSLDEWVLAGNSMESWDNNYVVEYIRDGYLGHWHVQESVINYYNKIIPYNLSFLIILSKHYKKINMLPVDLLDEIYKGNIFIEKVNCFKFTDSQ